MIMFWLISIGIVSLFMLGIFGIFFLIRDSLWSSSPEIMSGFRNMNINFFNAVGGFLSLNWFYVLAIIGIFIIVYYVYRIYENTELG